jgi:hypothetical protein
MTSIPAAGQAARLIRINGLRTAVIALSQNQQFEAESSLLTAESYKSGDPLA